MVKEVSGELLAEIVRRLTDVLHPLEIHLFGSQAGGSADRDSDIDLLVVVPETETPPRELARRGRRSLWGTRVPVDIVVCTASEKEKWSRVACNLIHTVSQKGRRLYAAAS